MRIRPSTDPLFKVGDTVVVTLPINKSASTFMVDILGVHPVHEPHSNALTRACMVRRKFLHWEYEVTSLPGGKKWEYLRINENQIRHATEQEIRNFRSRELGIL